MVQFPLLITPIETNYRACTIPYRFPSDNPKKPTPTELSWINLFANSIPSFKKRAESDDTVSDAPAKAEKFAQRYAEILEDFKKDLESHGGPPDCLHLYRIREHILREIGFRDIFKKVKVVLAANDLPSINDVTYHELLEIISKLKDENGKLMGVDTQNLLIANPGNDLPRACFASSSTLMRLFGILGGKLRHEAGMWRQDYIKVLKENECRYSIFRLEFLMMCHGTRCMILYEVKEIDHSDLVVLEIVLV